MINPARIDPTRPPCGPTPVTLAGEDRDAYGNGWRIAGRVWLGAHARWCASSSAFRAMDGTVK
jgi:hypothetical protein